MMKTERKRNRRNKMHRMQTCEEFEAAIMTHCNYECNLCPSKAWKSISFCAGFH